MFIHGQALVLLLSASTAFGAPPELPKVLTLATAKQYRDYYGSTYTRNPKLLSTPTGAFRWGITNPKPVDMAYFGGTLLSDAKHTKRFTATLVVDAKVKAPLVFTFKAGDRNGETLETLTVQPGSSTKVDFALNGAKALFFSTEVKINHGQVERVILGEPCFE